MSEARITNLSNESNTGGPTISGITTFSSPYFFIPPVGSTKERPENPEKGSIRFNTDSGHLEYFKGNSVGGWVDIESTEVSPVAPRGLFAGGYATGNADVNIIDYIEITTLGNALDFGDCNGAKQDSQTGVCNLTRMVWGGGNNPAVNVMDYVEIKSTGNATDFGDLVQNAASSAGLSDKVRGIIGGGNNPNYLSQLNVIQYFNIPTTGNTVDYGDLTAERDIPCGVSDATRGIFGGGRDNPAILNTIDYINIQTTGNAVDFGDTSVVRAPASGCSSSTRGLFAGGYSSPAKTNSIEYITIKSTGNGIDFGDLINATSGNAFGNNGNVASSTRGIFYMGGVSGVGDVNTIQYVTMTTLGNAADFGDLTRADQQVAGGSNSHGGLSG